MQFWTFFIEAHLYRGDLLALVDVKSQKVLFLGLLGYETWRVYYTSAIGKNQLKAWKRSILFTITDFMESVSIQLSESWDIIKVLSDRIHFIPT